VALIKALLHHGGGGGPRGCGGNGGSAGAYMGVGVYVEVERNETNGHHCYLVGQYVCIPI